MAVLVTRPQPDDEATASALRAKGFEVMLAPMLRFEPVAFHDDEDARYGAVVVTSANALRAIAANPAMAKFKPLPLFALGAKQDEGWRVRLSRAATFQSLSLLAICGYPAVREGGGCA